MDALMSTHKEYARPSLSNAFLMKKANAQQQPRIRQSFNTRIHAIGEGEVRKIQHRFFPTVVKSPRNRIRIVRKADKLLLSEAARLPLSREIENSACSTYRSFSTKRCMSLSPIGEIAHQSTKGDFMANTRLIGFSVFVAMAFVVFTSLAAEKDLVRAQDRVEIEQLMWNYIRALDSGNAEAYAALFAPDGQFGTGTTAVKGREALKKMVLDARQKMDAENKSGKKAPRMYHVVTNPHIEFVDKDHARFYAYWMGALASGGTTSAGREVNELVRIKGQWLISVRDVNPQD
jgi:uncharacterized protein (TIGR02246 family)